MSFRVAGLALVTSLLCASCYFETVDLSGRACDAMDRCAAGYRCDLGPHRCVLDSVDANASVDTNVDANRSDTNEDAFAFDTAIDVGPVDVGTDAGSDAGTPCTCHPTAEQCMPDGSCVAAPYEARPAGLVVHTLPASYRMGGDVNVDFDPGVFDAARFGRALDTIDVLVVPPNPLTGGSYANCTFTHLPTRTAARPLIITNGMGQLECNSLTMSGGSHWVLTGRYEAGVTGDMRYVGHARGYANTQGRYGILVHAGIQLRMDAGPYEGWEVEYVEVDGGASSYGTIVTAQETMDAVRLDGLRLHDLYLHDDLDPYTGVLLSMRAGSMSNVAFDHNRVVRMGGTCLDVNSFDSLVVRDNFFGLCNLLARARDPESPDPAVQFYPRASTLRFQNNVVMGTRGETMRVQQVSRTAVTGDVRLLHNAFFGIGGQGLALATPVPVSRTEVVIDDARFTFDFMQNSIDSAIRAPAWLVTLGGLDHATFRNVRWRSESVTEYADPMQLSLWERDVLASEAHQNTMPLPTFMGFMPADLSYAELVRIEGWMDTERRPLRRFDAGVSLDAGVTMPRSYPTGTRIVWNGQVWTATAPTSPTDVPGTSALWASPTRPADDVRVVADYAGYGLP